MAKTTVVKPTAKPKTTAKPISTVKTASVEKSPAQTETAVEEVVIASATPSEDSVTVRKKEFIARVIERAQTRQKIAKPIIEATLAVLSEALTNSESLNIQPLGQIKVKRIDEGEKATVVHCRVRMSKAAEASAGDAEEAQVFD